MGFLLGHIGAAPPRAAPLGPAMEARRKLFHRGAAEASWALERHGHGHALLLSSATRRGPRHLLAFDGRLNHRAALRAALREAGRAPGETDADMVLAAWECWAEAALHRLEGAFALAVLDLGSGVLSLACDRFGQRPLLLASGGGATCFASELPALLEWGVIGRALALDVAAATLSFGHVPGDECLMGGVRRLPPGHVVALRPNGAAAERPWWTLPTPAAADAGDVRAQLHETVRAIAGASPAALTQGEGAGLLQACLAADTGEPALPPPDATLLASLIERQGGPIAADVVLPALAAGRAATTVLAPAGAGALLLAHRRYRAFGQALQAMRDGSPQAPEGGFHQAAPTARELWHAASGGMAEADRLELLGPALLHTAVLDAGARYGTALCAPTPDRAIEEAARLDLTQRLPARELAGLDAACATTGAEPLCPFLDAALVTALLGLPGALRRWLIQAPAPTPPDLSAWHPMAPALRPFTEASLLDAACRERDLFSRGRVEALLRRHAASPGLDPTVPWRLLGLELWCRSFLDAPRRAEAQPLDETELRLVDNAREAA